MIWFLAYCAGFTITTGVICGANAYARVLDKPEPFDWEMDRHFDDSAVIRNIFAMVGWPIAWLVFASNALLRRAARARKRRLELAAEEQRLIEEALR